MKNATPTGRNLRRMFSLVPLIHNNQGVSLDALRELAGYATIKQLRQDLERLMMFGVPPFSPSDFITVFIDEDSRVFLDFPHGLERPPALSPAEWTAVQKLITREIQFQSQSSGGRGNEDSLREILERISTFPVELESADIVRTKRNLVLEALGLDDDEPLQLEFRYRTLSSKEPELRRVDPWALIKHHGISYLIGFCHTRAAPRFFHLERMDHIELLDLPRVQEPPANLEDFFQNSPIFQDRPAGFTVELAFAPDMRAALERAFQLTDVGTPTDSRDDARAESLPAEYLFRIPANWLYGRCKVPESLWFRSQLRGMGARVIILSPEHMRSSYRAELEEYPVPGLLI